MSGGQYSLLLSSIYQLIRIGTVLVLIIISDFVESFMVHVFKN